MSMQKNKRQIMKKLLRKQFNCSEFKSKTPFVGFYNFTTPYLLVIDPELAKQIMIKDFKHFRNNEFGSLVRCENINRD